VLTNPKEPKIAAPDAQGNLQKNQNSVWTNLMARLVQFKDKAVGADTHIG
jgi:hypothetical protein